MGAIIYRDRSGYFATVYLFKNKSGFIEMKNINGNS